MYIQIGDYRYDNLYVQSHESSLAGAVSDHEVINSVGRVQAHGRAPEVVNLRFQFTALNTVPEDQVAGLRTLLAKSSAGQAWPYLIGNGTYRGEFLVTEVQETQTVTDAKGNLVAVEVAVTLKEHWDPDRKAAAERQQRAIAKANFEVAPYKKPAVLPEPPAATGGDPETSAGLPDPPAPTEAAQTSQNVFEEANRAAKLTELIGQAIADPSRMGELAGEAAKLYEGLGDIATTIQNGQPYFDAVVTNVDAVTNLQTLAADLGTAIEDGNPQVLQSIGVQLGSATQAYQAGMNPLLVAAAVRQA